MEQQQEQEFIMPEGEFRADVAAGLPGSYVELEPITGTNALHIAWNAASGVCEHLVPQHGTRLKYYLAAQLLGSLDGWEWDEFKEMVEAADGDPDALAEDWEFDFEDGDVDEQ